MTFSKEDLSRAFNEVLSERVPDLSDMPDHVFSERFEKRMEKLIKKEAAHPWAVSHTAARNVLIAALIALLLFSLSMSVSGIRNAVFNFFTRHFDAYNEVVFEDTGRTEIEHVYEITALPEGFELTDVINDNTLVLRHYENNKGSFINFRQTVPSAGSDSIIDNEKTIIKTIELDGRILFYAYSDSLMNLAWEEYGYEFWIDIHIPGFSFNQAIQIYNSIQ